MTTGHMAYIPTMNESNISVQQLSAAYFLCIYTVVITDLIAANIQNRAKTKVSVS